MRLTVTIEKYERSTNDFSKIIISRSKVLIHYVDI